MDTRLGYLVSLFKKIIKKVTSQNSRMFCDFFGVHTYINYCHYLLSLNALTKVS